jgi:hypothetical protein
METHLLNLAAIESDAQLFYRDWTAMLLGVTR